MLLAGLILSIILLSAACFSFRREIYARLLHLTPPQYQVAVERGITIPMRDGIMLATDHYAPRDRGSFPTILIRCPYGRNPRAGGFGLLLDFFVWRFAERGYHVVVQDTRGRFDSGGEFAPYVAERNDGLATVTWLQRQPWFNGSLGTWGPSYLGIVQWALAPGSPAVKAILPLVSASKPYLIAFPDGALDLGLAMRWAAIFKALDKGKGGAVWKAVPALLATEQRVTPAFAHLPLIEVDEVAVGAPVTFYRQWLEHSAAEDTLWRNIEQEMSLANIDAPALIVGGWYDFFLRGVLADYAELKAAGKNPYLTIGPGSHFSQAMHLIDGLHEGIIWFDALLKEDRRRLREKPVHLYVIGTRQWRDFDSWPPPATPRRYYLSSEFALCSEASQGEQAPDHYRYNPADPTPAVGGTQFSLWAGARSNRRLEARSDVLIYTSEPLDKPLDVIGSVCLQLYVKSTLEYTDFFGRLCDVQRSGVSTNICDGLFRIRPGNGQRQPDGSLYIEIDMWATAYRFKRGHRIRLQVSSGAHPRWMRNLGTNEPLAYATTMQAADQTIFHDQTHPSALVLPISAS